MTFGPIFLEDLWTKLCTKYSGIRNKNMDVSWADNSVKN